MAAWMPVHYCATKLCLPPKNQHTTNPGQPNISFLIDVAAAACCWYQQKAKTWFQKQLVSLVSHCTALKTVGGCAIKISSHALAEHGEH